MKPPRKPRAPPPQVVAGVGPVGFEGEPVHIAELWARELVQARDMKHRAWAKQGEADALDARLPGLASTEADALRTRLDQLRRQAFDEITTAERIHARVVADMRRAVDHAHREARGVQARRQVRQRASAVTREYFSLAVEATLQDDEELTARNLRIRWPKGCNCPSERHLNNMLRDREQEQLE
ncbi:hypothetical protein ABIE51_002457 [Lysobacter sp. OAE881]|uniref:hypothetical protein n=1 Tax=Lysobacter sp. OAE881 TaxID=2663813 RepID=UPI00178AAAC7